VTERFRAAVSRALAHPHAVLAAGVVLIAGCEYGREQLRGVSWAFVELAIAALVLALVWPARSRLLLLPLLGVALALSLAWIAARAHATLGLDFEWREVYAREGQALLDGRYPRSEYPAGAVSLFAVEAWLGGTKTHFTHALLMVPFQLASVAAVWSLRTRWSAWFAAVLAFWPMNAWFWEYRFDLVPTGLLAVGLALAWRRHWALAGIALGLGAAVKWTPALAVPPLLAYLAFSRQSREAIRLALGVAASVAFVYVPYLASSPSPLWAAYSTQGGRSITDESLWHLLLRPLGVEGRHNFGYPLFGSVRPPEWADATAIAVQVALLLGLTVLAARGCSLRAAVALAAMTPVVFLVTNRVFSVQYFVLLLAAWAIGAALLAAGEREALILTLAALAATVANVLIIPYPVHRAHVWEIASAVRFALGIGVTAWLVLRASRLSSSSAERRARLPARC
jgi:Glycosyltransferase family 87